MSALGRTIACRLNVMLCQEFLKEKAILEMNLSTMLMTLGLRPEQQSTIPIPCCILTEARYTNCWPQAFLVKCLICMSMVVRRLPAAAWFGLIGMYKVDCQFCGAQACIVVCRCLLRTVHVPTKALGLHKNEQAEMAIRPCVM